MGFIIFLSQEKLNKRIILWGDNIEKIVVVDNSPGARFAVKQCIKSFKKEACERAESNCEKCEAAYKQGDKQCCCFDTVIRLG